MSQKNVYLEKIANLIENLPSEHLRKLAQTQDQIDEWESMRKTNRIIAECWRSKFIFSEDDPIAQARDKKEIDELKYQGIWLVVDQYKTLWDIVQIAEPYVRAIHYLLRAVSYFFVDVKSESGAKFTKVYGVIFKNEYSFTSAYELLS